MNKTFLKYLEFIKLKKNQPITEEGSVDLKQRGICEYCGNTYNLCTCSADNHNNVRFKKYEPTEKESTDKIKDQIIPTKKQENNG